MINDKIYHILKYNKDNLLTCENPALILVNVGQLYLVMEKLLMHFSPPKSITF